MVALVLSMLSVAMLPGTALAKNNNENPRETRFTATAQLAVVNGGEVEATPIGENFILQKTTGEMVAGEVLSSKKWPEIAGAQILFIHESRTIMNLRSNKITGTAVGTILIGKINADYTGMAEVWMQGNYRALIRGSFTLDGEETPVIYDKIFDAARFDLEGVGYGFEGVSASGRGLAKLTWQEVNPPGIYTLAGPMLLNGTYK